MAQSELFETRAPPVESRPVELDVLGFLERFGEENSTAERCYRSHSRSSVLQGLPFGGVPTVLVINVVIWMVNTQQYKNITLRCKSLEARFHYILLQGARLSYHVY